MSKINIPDESQAIETALSQSGPIMDSSVRFIRRSLITALALAAATLCSDQAFAGPKELCANPSRSDGCAKVCRSWEKNMALDAAVNAACGGAKPAPVQEAVQHIRKPHPDGGTAAPSTGMTVEEIKKMLEEATAQGKKEAEEMINRKIAQEKAKEKAVGSNGVLYDKTLGMLKGKGVAAYIVLALATLIGYLRIRRGQKVIIDNQELVAGKKVRGRGSSADCGGPDTDGSPDADEE